MLWPDSGDAQAKNSLRQALSNLRKALNTDERSVINADIRQIWIDAPGRHVDVVQLRALANSTNPIDVVDAAELYQGAFLDGCPIPPEFETWVRNTRSDLHREDSSPKRWRNVSIASQIYSLVPAKISPVEYWQAIRPMRLRTVRSFRPWSRWAARQRH